MGIDISMVDTTDVSVDYRPESKSKSKLREYTEAIIWALALSFLIRTFIVASFEIPSGSMEDTLLIGDYLLANKFIYGITIPWTSYKVLKVRNPHRGDIVIFKYPLDPSQDFIKRVVGVPGDEIQIRDKQVYVNGSMYTNPHEIHSDLHIIPQGQGVRDNFGPVRVPENAYFMMGDNRDNSYDSRFWGYVKDRDIVGEALFKYWSWDKEKWRPRWQRIGRLIN
jgi:signal peptidase I